MNTYSPELCASYYSMCFKHINSFQIGMINISLLEMGNNLRVFKELAQKTAGNFHNWYLNPGSLAQVHAVVYNDKCFHFTH